jgi:murein DD-endopeptidase MepM/ murein hydrolase activator NlpD
MNQKKWVMVLAILFMGAALLPLWGVPVPGGDKEVTTLESYERRLVPLSFETEYEYTEDVSEGVSALIFLGAPGLGEEVKRVVRENGFVVSEEVIAVRTIKEPVNQKVLTGTRKVAVYGSGNHSIISYDGPVISGTGNFICPVQGYVFSSPYGPRNGRMHYGVDLTAPVGTPIYASDDGTVIFVGSRNSYGLLVIVDHGNGYKTYYSHCNTIHVSLGEDVAQGQTIATVGRTGNATGSHIHFEIRYNEACVNPETYISF